MFKYPSIEQFRHTVKDVENKECSKEITFNRTVKLHGSNAAVVLDIESGEVYAQSRNRIITPEDDNAGFAKYVEENKEELKGIIEKYTKYYGDDTNPSHVVIYGEWCGEGIQRGVAVNKLPKMFVVFDVRIVHNSNLEISFFEKSVEIINLSFQEPSISLYNIFKFDSRYITLNFANPVELQQELLKDVQDVELECPVAAHFGVFGVGEGYVYTSNCGKYKFKVKGEKHTVSKTKVMTAEESEAMSAVADFVIDTVTEVRLNQGIEYLKEMNLPIENKSLGEYIKWVVTDLLKEEGDLVEELKLNPKAVNKQVSKVARLFFQSQL